MSILSDLRFRLRAVFDRAAVERELDTELRFHLERETEKLMAMGMTRDDAARRATLSFGGLDRIKDDARDARGVDRWESLTQDVRYAWRGLRARPGFSSVIVLALAIGIGANATMFSIVDRLMLRPPAYLDSPERVHRVYLSFTRSNQRSTSRIIEYARYADLARWTSSFDAIGVIAYRTMAIGSGDETRDLPIAAMSATMFRFFSARPIIGRFYDSSDDVPPAGNAVAVLSWGFWQSRFGGRADALGQSLRVGTKTYSVIGVAPRDFVGITDDSPPALFVPITSVASQRSLTYHQAYGWSWLEMFARRRDGVTAATADADLTNAFRRSWEAALVTRPDYPPLSAASPQAMVGAVHLSRGPEASPESRMFAWILGVAAIVLLIACANVTNLMLARAVTRRREVALRLALGVGRGRLVQQFATESALLALISGGAGVAIAYGGALLIRPFLGTAGPVQDLLSARTFAFVIAITIAVAMITGLAPLLHVLRGDVNDALKSGGRGMAAQASPARAGLLLAQAALSLALIIGAGLFARSLWNLRTLPMGYDAQGVLYAEAVWRGVRLTGAERRAMALRMEAAAATTPGVRAASVAASIPFWTNESAGAPLVEGRDSLGRHGSFLVQAASPSYFRVMGTRVLAGRGILATDRPETPPVAVVSQRMAEVIWPGEQALGKQFRILSDTSPAITVVGVAENMRARLIDQRDEIWLYVPYAQYANFDAQVLIRVDGDAEAALESMRRRLLRVMPAGASVNVIPLEAIVRRQGRSWELGARLFFGLGGIALFLAATGLYSAIAYAVAQRTREFGIRMALGATGRDVARLVVTEGVRFAGIGIAIGGCLAIWASRWIEPLLFDQKALDPATFLAAAGILAAVALAACVRPALRAVRLNASEVLQSD